jgi:hypothetical protein
MVVTSALIPPLAVAHRLRGELQVRLGSRRPPKNATRAVLFAGARAVLVPTRHTKVDEVEARCFDAALVLTSFHQSPLPLALLLRMAKVPWIGAICDDYPGSLLDLRHRVPDGLPESERNLSLANAAGFVADEKGARLAVRHPLPDVTGRVGALRGIPSRRGGAGKTSHGGIQPGHLWQPWRRPAIKWS